MSIHAKLILCLRDIEAIGKNKKNAAQGFNYRGIDDVYNALNPILAKHGVFTAPEVLKIDREQLVNAKGTALRFSIVTMKHKFYAEDGTCVETTVVGEGMDSGDKATNKAMAIAHKYALFQIFCIPTEDMPDPDAEVHVVVAKPPTRISKEQADRLFKMNEDPALATRIEAALDYFKKELIEDLSSEQANQLINKLSK
jgi:hypothetical protein